MGWLGEECSRRSARRVLLVSHGGLLSEAFGGREFENLECRALDISPDGSFQRSAWWSSCLTQRWRFECFEDIRSSWNLNVCSSRQARRAFLCIFRLSSRLETDGKLSYRLGFNPLC